MSATPGPAAVRFACAGCGQALTGVLRAVDLPVPTGERSWDAPTPLLAAGTFAVDTDADTTDGAGRTTPGPVVLHPDDLRGVVPHPDRGRSSGCCGHDGLDGPDRVCGGCGTEVATLRDDCWVGWSTVRLEPARGRPHRVSRRTQGPAGVAACGTGQHRAPRPWRERGSAGVRGGT